MVDFIGAARDPQFRQDVGRGLVDAFGRGLSMIGGAPVDLTTMFLRPLGYSAPDEQIIGSSEYLGRQMANLGLISETRNPVAEFLSALLIPDPTDIQKLAPYVQRAMSADLVAARPNTPGAAMAMQRGSVGVEPSGKVDDAISAASKVNDFSYRGFHTAPGPDFGAPLHDLTGGGQIYPADVYSPRAVQYYGTGYPKADREAFAIAQKVKGNPDATVTIYRAVPKDPNIKNINEGDWVTLSKDYAKNHGESVLGDYKIIEQKVKAKELWTNADSIHEFGYWPSTPSMAKAIPQAPREEALRIAQQNAAKPISEGGLGLPPDNTAMDRARAMGFVTPAYRGTTADEVLSKPKTFVSENPDISNEYAGYLKDWADDPEMLDAMMKLTPHGNVMPLLVKDAEKGRARTSIPDYEMILDPEQIRSRFAAFDPARRYESDLLGSVDPRLLAILGPAAAASVYGLGELYANQRRNEQTR